MKIEFTKEEASKIMKPHRLKDVMKKHAMDLFATETHKELNLADSIIEVNENYLGDVTVEIVPIGGPEETEDETVE